METIITVLSAILSIASLVCWIMVLIPSFKENIWFGILGIVTCGLFALVWGWVRVGQYGIKNVMIVWTICFVANLVLTFMQMGAMVEGG